MLPSISPPHRNKDGRKKRNKGKRQLERARNYAERQKEERERREREDKLASESALHIIRFMAEARRVGVWREEYKSAADQLITMTVAFYSVWGVKSPFGAAYGSGQSEHMSVEQAREIKYQRQNAIKLALDYVLCEAGVDAYAAVSCLCVSNAPYELSAFQDGINGLWALAKYFGYL